VCGKRFAVQLRLQRGVFPPSPLPAWNVAGRGWVRPGELGAGLMEGNAHEILGRREREKIWYKNWGGKEGIETNLRGENSLQNSMDP